MSECRLILGDCLEILPTLEAGSVDAIITDLPYGTTACSWDEVIPFAPMWEQVKRVLKPRGAFVTTASQPFTSKLVMSNAEWFRYEWIWQKSRPSNPFLRKNQPLKFHENIVVFAPMPAHNSANVSCVFFAQMEMRKPENVRNCKPRINNHDGVYGDSRKIGDEAKGFSAEIFPKSILDVPDRDDGVHPTQKPVALYAYLIRTYTNAGDTVLDFVMGSGTSGVAAVKEGRHFVGVELDEGYFKVAERRIAEAQMQLPLLAGF